MKHLLIQIRRLAWSTSKGHTTLGVLLMLVSLSVPATTLPEYYPETFQTRGVIDRINIKSGEIVVNDNLARLSNNAKVHNLNTEFSTVQTLRKGMKIGFVMNSINGKRFVTEIWVLPNNYSSGRSE